MKRTERKKERKTDSQGHGCLCCVLYSKDKGTSLDNQEKEAGTEKVLPWLVLM
jgi:hypothetical protein